MKTIILNIGLFLSTIGFLSAQSDQNIKSDSIAKGVTKQSIFTSDSLQFALQDKHGKPLITPEENQAFFYETDPVFKMPIVKPRYKSQMPILKPGTESIYNMPRKQFYPK